MFPFLLPFLLFLAPGWILSKRRKRKESFFHSSLPPSLHFFIPAFCKLPPLRVHVLCTVVSTPHAGGPPGSLSMGFPRQEYWSGLPCPPPGDLPDPGTEPTSSASPVLAGEFSTPGPPNSLSYLYVICQQRWLDRH